MLSDELFGQASRDLAEGGFSVRTAGRGAGKGPQGDKLMVGGYEGRSADYPSTPPLAGHDLKRFASEHHDALKQPSTYMGGWVGGDGRQSLDVSKAYPQHGGTYKARIAAAEGNQEAIGVIKKGAYAGEQVYPYYVSSESQSGRNPDLFDSAWAGSRGGAKVDSAWQNIKGA